MNGLTFFAVLALLFIAGCVTYALKAKPEQQPEDPASDPDVIAHDFHEESQL